jgi:hypothetical protein
MSNIQSYNPRPAHSPAVGGVVVREANGRDAAPLERLAQLDSARVPAAPMLVAEVDGELRAAISMADGAVIANPFARTHDLVAMLQTRAGHLPTAQRPLIPHLGRLVTGRPRRRPRPSAPSVPGLPSIP